MAILMHEDGWMHRLHNSLGAAFGKIKQDFSHVFDWINYFHQKHQEHDSRLGEIERQLYYMPKTREEIKQIIEGYYSYEHVLEKIKELSERMDNIEQARIEKKFDAREKLMKRIARNSKDYVKGIILSMLKRYERIPASQLKTIIVEEQGLCSKSSFYRLLQELEDDDRIDFMTSGKEKVYQFKGEITDRKV
jgi:hypothetical protein